jgi:hypothetical protein
MLATWPLGIALALATLGALADATTWRTAILVTTLHAALAFGLMLLFYREPTACARGERRRAALVDDHRAGGHAHRGGRPGVGHAERRLHPAPELRAEAPPGAGRRPRQREPRRRLASFLSIATVPLGGALLDRVRRGDAVITVGLAGGGRAPRAARSHSVARPRSGARSWASWSRPPPAWWHFPARCSPRGAAARGSGSCRPGHDAGDALARDRPLGVAPAVPPLGVRVLRGSPRPRAAGGWVRVGDRSARRHRRGRDPDAA